MTTKLVYDKAQRTIVCPYCGTKDGLRRVHDGYGAVPPEYTCAACFTATDTGPCFDDLPKAVWTDAETGASTSDPEIAAEWARAGRPMVSTNVPTRPEWIAVAQDAEGFWTCREATVGSQQYVRADLFEQAIKALRSLTDGDAAYFGNDIRIACESHADAIKRMVTARAVVARYEQSTPNSLTPSPTTAEGE